MSEKKHFNVVIIGAGPGGYVAAIRAAQNGASVALVERSALGGSCLNVGCIPTKALLARAGLFAAMKRSEDFGIHVSGLTADFPKWIEQKDAVVAQLRKGINGLIGANGITLYRGVGSFSSPHEIKVLGDDPALLGFDSAIIATGSDCKNISAFPFDGERIHSSSTLLDFTKVPRKLCVIGGGYIGCEAASLYNALGTEVVILEMLPTILPTEGAEIAGAMTELFTRRGMSIRTGTPVQSIEHTESGILVHVEPGESVEADIALVAIGRDLNTSQIGLEKAGIATGPGGVIPVNERMETPVSGIYAIGDITGKMMLAHMASHQGLVAADNATGQRSRIHYHAVPSVIFTQPEIGSVGMTLEKARAAGYDALDAKFPFQALGKSQAIGETEGFARLVVDRKTNQILGAQVIGHDAATLIAQATLAITNELTLESIAETIHAHPTLSESWLEAALLGMGRPLHLPPKRARR